MNTMVVCRDVRPAAENDKVCVIVASKDDLESVRAIDPTDASNLSEVKERLRSQGIVLGGLSLPARKTSTQSSLRSPVQIIAHDEQGKEHRLIADSLDEYSLSSGSTLYYLFVPQVPSDF